MRRKEEFEVSFEELYYKDVVTPKSWRFIYEWLDSLVFALITILVIFTFAFRVVGVSGESMVPTLQDGDWLAVKSINTQIKQGDIVVVTQPNSLNEPISKRVIALAGDEVNINFAEGTVSVNGVVLNEPYINEPTARSYDKAFPITVPDNSVFVMGDNRNRSIDSRSSIIGFIDQRYILGVAEVRFFPIGDWKLDNYEK
ncbi:MAG: signal peptidase I [Oscillospiraceae bacterium]